MKFIQRNILTGSVLALFFASCETLPKTESQEALQSVSGQTIAGQTAGESRYERPYDLVSRSEVVATVKSKAVAVDLERQALEWGYTLKKEEKLDGLNLILLTFDCPPGVDPKDASLELERLQPKASVGELHKYELSSSARSLSNPQTPKIFANEMLQWPASGCESHVKIGMIDGGLSQIFLDQSSAKIHRASFVDNTPSETAVMHGTSIGSILTDSSLLNGVELYSAAVVSQDKNGADYSSPTAILKALDWMVLNEVKVVNISLSGPPNRILEAALDVATQKGLIIVAAVGNQGQNSAPQFPAAYNSVLAATAVDVEGDIYDKAVRGNHVDFSAPGVDVYVKTTSRQGKYISGTSIAAPFITAAIASSPSALDHKTRDDIIRHFANFTTDLGPAGKDRTFGLGLINAKHICSAG